VKKGEFYYLSTNQHIKNERVYFARRGAVGDTIIQQVVRGAIRERRHKLVQFRIIFWLLTHGRPMNNYEAVQELMAQLGVPECPQRHWSVGAGWEMADSIVHVLGEYTKTVMDRLVISQFLLMRLQVLITNPGCHCMLIYHWDLNVAPFFWH
jgi:hypothetical protein